MEDKIYELTDKYQELDDIGRDLINEIARYCEENGKFPAVRDMSLKNGYIARSQYYKYFGEGKFKNIYNYIVPKKEDFIKCTICHKLKRNIQENFPRKNNYNTFICRQCIQERDRRRNWKKQGITFNEITDISVIQWWNYRQEGRIQRLPDFCYEKENLIKLIKYICKKNNLNSKKSLIDGFKSSFFKQNNIKNMILMLGGKLKSLQLCFPEYKFSENDFQKFKDGYIIQQIENYLFKNHITVNDILSGGVYGKNNTEFCNLTNYCFKNKNMTINELFLFYFDNKNILHPEFKRKISIYDFNHHSNNFYKNKNNRINKIKHYCEKQCETSILNAINNTSLLLKWVKQYFNAERIKLFSLPYHPYYKSLYEILISAYPCIVNNKILFEWEWQQCSKNNRTFLINCMRDFVFYRLSHLVKIEDFVQDIPKYINTNFLNSVGYGKFDKHIFKKRFSSYYEWCCLAFPEYKEKWSCKDFSLNISKDNNIFDSYAEMQVYEYIQDNYFFQHIEAIGQRSNGSNKIGFNISNYNCARTKVIFPDFRISNINFNNAIIKLKKPIIIEYYGMYNPKNPNHIFKSYVKKTKIKEDFYKNNKDIYYLGIFPEDIKNNFKILDIKLNKIKTEILTKELGRYRTKLNEVG